MISSGDAVTLDGSGSWDSDDGIGAYLWEQTAGPKVSLSDAGAESPTFDAPDGVSDGTEIQFRLTVTDTGGLEDVNTVTLAFSSSLPGRFLWKAQLGGKVSSSPAAGADGTIYVGCDDGFLADTRKLYVTEHN